MSLCRAKSDCLYSYIDARQIPEDHEKQILRTHERVNLTKRAVQSILKNSLLLVLIASAQAAFTAVSSELCSFYVRS